MIPLETSPEQAVRPAAIGRYDVLDTPPEQTLDDLTRLAAAICETPIALISLADEKRLWLKSKVGLEAVEIPHDFSFCAAAMDERSLLIVPDATRDPRFAGNPLVTSELAIRFYAAAPLLTPEGDAIGTLCVLDRVPRTLTPVQEQTLLVLARQVMTHLELRRQTRELTASEERLRIVTENARVGLVIVNRERRYVFANSAYAEILGLNSPAIIGQRVADVLAGLYEEQVRPRLDRAFAGEHVAFELHRAAKGSDYHYAVRYQPAEVDGAVELVVVVITDITERKAAVAESERQHAEIQMILDAVPALVFYKDREGRFLCVNRELAQLMEIPPEAFLGKTDAEMGAPDWERYREDDLCVMTTGEPIHHLEEKLETPTGTHWLLTDKIPRRDEAGNIIGVIGFAVDITGRKQAKEALYESIRFARSTIDALSAHLCVLDENGAILTTNEAWRRFAEANPPRTRQAYVGENYLQVCDTTSGEEAKDAAVFAAGIRAVLRGESTDFAMEYPCHSPSEQRWFIGRVTRFPGDGPVRVVVTHENITARKRNEARFRRLVDSNAQGVIFWNTKGGISDANDAFLQMVGYTREDVEARRIGWVQITPPEYADLDEHALEEIAAKGICAPFEKEYIRKDGSRVPVLIGAATFEDTPDEGVCFVLDLTERKKLEQQFLRAQRMESIGTLAGGIAHDLNNSLGPIIMSIDLLKMKFTDRESRELIDIIATSARRGADMVSQVLSFARGVEGRRMEVQVRHLIADIEKIVNETFFKNIQVRTNIADGLWPVIGDPTQIHQVLLNLSVNARDAMPNGGTLTFSAENITLDAHYAALNPDARPGAYVFLNIEDSGTGIPQETLEKIFDPFFTTKEIGQGTGLGLSTSLAIVKSHGGFIRVYSEMGKGTKFHVNLPAQTGTPTDTVMEMEARMPRGSGELILVVDDEASVRQITRQTLETFGYRVILAADGAEAVATYAVRSQEIAAVLTDMMMPIMDGPATIQVLRKMNPALRVIGASGLAAKDHIAKAASLGVKRFLPKPFTAETLLKVLKRVLEGE